MLHQFAAGDWLNRRTAVLCAAVLLVLELAGFLFLVAGTNGLIVRLERPVSVDFVSFYAAGELAAEGHPRLAYDQAAHFAAEQRVTAPGINYQYFFYPPVFLLLCRALAALPYLAAFLLFEAATLALLLAALRTILDERGWGWAVVALAAPAGFWTLGLGQNAFLTAALFGGATALLERRPVLAGLLLGALCYKPHFGLLVPVALAAGGHWRAFAAAALAAAALLLAALALFGWATWHDYLHSLAASPQLFAVGKAAKLSGQITPFGALRLIGIGEAAARALQACVSVLAAALVGWVWSRPTSLPVRSAALVSGTLLAVPVAVIYDLTLGLVAIAWLIRAGRARRYLAWEKLIYVVAFLAPLFQIQTAEATHVSPAPFAAAGLFALALLRARQESAARSPGSEVHRVGSAVIATPAKAGGGNPAPPRSPMDCFFPRINTTSCR